ncbi:glycosyltransferase [Paracoccus sp. SCSIO 75233]|uniref:glycosyltransferase n=1 Tax=Paracoccus sp. SCSIO 75233 TaxID=3017782 RepID=UPI0022F07CA0|nr:glycosyltransferase [Paracoccus sp. SCSIO 75233]WBU53805.1 glycosyltransferase [Paracoccus sp. SCSIO 75233]
MILHVITNFEANGGAETMLARLLHEYREPAIVASLMGVSERNITLASNPQVTYECLNAHSMRKLPGAVWELSRIIRQHRPSAILCWMYHGMVIGSAASALSRHKAPLFWTVRQALDDPNALTRSTRMAVSATKRLSSRNSGIIYNSERARFQHRDYGFDDRRAVVIPNGFVLPAFSDSKRAKAEIFGLAARFHKQKDFGNFFQAAAIAARANPALRFVAAGKSVTSENPEILRLMEVAGLDYSRIELMGEQRDMSSFYRNIDALVLSSRTEGFPNVVGEAMSHGKVVVTTDVGDAGKIVGTTGIVVPPGDAEALARGILNVANWSPEQYRNAGKAAYDRIGRDYSLERIVRAYRDILLREI